MAKQDKEVAETTEQKKKRELRDTLLADPRIKVLYFDRSGNHFYRSFQADTGKKYSHFHVTYSKDNAGKTTRIEKPLPENEIVETISVTDWLKKNT